MKPKGDEKASNGIVQKGESIGLHYVESETSSQNWTGKEIIGIPPTPAATPVKTKLTSVRLMTIFELLTDKSFPRKGKGKSTKVKILDAIIMAAIDKKLIIQEEKDAKSRGN